MMPPLPHARRRRGPPSRWSRDHLARGRTARLPDRDRLWARIGADASPRSTRWPRSRVGRPGKPFLLLVSGTGDGGGMGPRLFPRRPSALAEAFWPGPLTLVLPGGEGRLPDRAARAGGRHRRAVHLAAWHRRLVDALRHPAHLHLGQSPGWPARARRQTVSRRSSRAEVGGARSSSSTAACWAMCRRRRWWTAPSPCRAWCARAPFPARNSAARSEASRRDGPVADARSASSCRLHRQHLPEPDGARRCFAQALAARGVDEVEVSSAGTGAWEGAPVVGGRLSGGARDRVSISLAHRARLLTPEVAADAGLLLTMARHHRARVPSWAATPRCTCSANSPAGTGRTPRSRDPYGADLEVYRRHVRRALDLDDRRRRRADRRPSGLMIGG